MSRVDPSEAFRLAETTVRREHLEAVLEQLPTPIVLIEPGSGLITFANRAADELAGGRFPRGTVEERMVGRPATDGAGQPLANADLPSMRIARGEQLRGARLEWRLPDRLLSLLVSGQIVTDGDGRDVGIVLFEDLGPMRAAERLRDESLALLDTIFESAPVGLALHGPDLRFVRVNRELASFNGISVEEHIGRTISELVPSVSPVVEDAVRSVLETGRPITGVEISGETPGRRGVVQTWMCGWYPVRQGSEGEIVGVGAVVTEITDRAALLEAERTARERAERAERQAAYLAEVGEILAGSLNWEENLARVVRVSVRAKAQWCTANLLQRDGTIRRLAGAHRDPAREHVLPELQRRYPLTIDDPVGAGSVLRSGRPELMREIDEEVLRSITSDAGHMALVQQLGMASRMIVPIVVRGRMTGTLTFARGPGERPYTLEDLRIVMEVARRAATGIAHAELYRERSHIAHTLQRSLLPPRLPDIAGFELAARYRAAGEGFDVGGDFYDAFETRDGWALAVGDVCGKGPEAASLTSLARSALRTGAVVESSPSRVLEVTNEAVLRERIGDRFLTALFLILEPDTGTLVSANAGHPPLLVLRAGGEVELVEGRGPVLGVLDDVPFEDAEIVLEPGDAIIAYTDGVLDAGAPDRLLDTAALARLAAEHTGRSAAELAEALERAALEVYAGAPRDDIAVLSCGEEGALGERELALRVGHARRGAAGPIALGAVDARAADAEAPRTRGRAEQLVVLDALGDDVRAGLGRNAAMAANTARPGRCATRSRRCGRSSRSPTGAAEHLQPGVADADVVERDPQAGGAQVLDAAQDGLRGGADALGDLDDHAGRVELGAADRVGEPGVAVRVAVERLGRDVDEERGAGRQVLRALEGAADAQRVELVHAARALRDVERLQGPAKPCSPGTRASASTASRSPESRCQIGW